MRQQQGSDKDRAEWAAEMLRIQAWLESKWPQILADAGDGGGRTAAQVIVDDLMGNPEHARALDRLEYLRRLIMGTQAPTAYAEKRTPPFVPANGWKS